jgi:4-amino-4-deoxy-L-arabinose transferase-like glycosyltransferase
VAGAALARFRRLRADAFDARVDLAIIGAITLLAAILRLWDLGSIPLGLHGDEAWTGIDARRVLHEGWIGPYLPSAVGQPIGPVYFTALIFKFLPQTTFTLRFSMALFGIATIPLAYAVFATMFDRTVAAFASLLLAVMMWHLHLSRTGFMVVSWPFIEMAALLALWHAMRLRSYALFVLAGALTGAGVYTYNAFYLFFPLPFVAMLWTYVPWRGRTWRWRTALHVALFALVALLVALPMIQYIDDHTEVYRSHQKLVSITNSDSWKGADGIGEHAHVVWRRAVEWTDGLVNGGRPDFGDGLATDHHPPLGRLTALLALIGVGVALWNWRNAAYAVVLASLLVMPLGALLTTGDGLFRRTLGLAPFIALLAAIPLALLWERLWRLRGNARYAAALALVIPAYLGVTTTYAYFGPVQDDVNFKVIYPYQMDAASHYVAGLPAGTFVYFYSGTWSFYYETRRFIAPHAVGVDRSDQFRQPMSVTNDEPLDFSVDRSRSVAFVFLDPYLDNLDSVIAEYPGGRVTDVTKGDETLFLAYYLPHGG